MKKFLIIFILVLISYFAYKLYLLKTYKYVIPTGENYAKVEKTKIDFIDIKHEDSDDLADLDIIKIGNIDLLKNHRIYAMKKILLTTRIYMLSKESGPHIIGKVYGNEKIDDNDDFYTGLMLLINDLSSKEYKNGSQLEMLEQNLNETKFKIDIDSIYKKYNIKSDIDLLYQSYKQKNKKINIFSSKKSIIEKYVFNMAYMHTVPIAKKILFLTGDEYGYIVISENINCLRLQKNDFVITINFDKGYVSEEDLVKIASTITYDYEKLKKAANECNSC